MRLLLKRDIQAVIVPISSFILLLVCLTLRDEVCAWIWIRDMRQHAKSNIDYAKTLHRFWYHFCFGFAFIMPGCFPITLFSFFFSSTHCIFQTKIQSSVFNWVQRFYDKKIKNYAGESDFDFTCFGIIPNKSLMWNLFMRFVSASFKVNALQFILFHVHTYSICVDFSWNSLLYQYWIKSCRVHCSRHCTWVHFHAVLYRFKEMRFNPERAHQFKLENFVFFSTE